MKQQQQPKQETDRGAKVIQLAIWLMENAKARGWSDAIEQAGKQVK